MPAVFISALRIIHLRYIIVYMLKTKRLILACLVLALGLAVGFVLTQIFKTYDFPVAAPFEPGDRPTLSDAKVAELDLAIKSELKAKTGKEFISLEPQLLLSNFPNLTPDDFDGIEAVVGTYSIVNGELTYTSLEVQDEAADDISSEGLKTLLANYLRRVNLPLLTPTNEIITSLQNPAAPATDNPDKTDDFVACTMDAMQCPDGSYVGRTGPNCEFACPAGDTPNPNEIVCTAEQKKADACIEIYAPVCANVQVECITAPCNPVPQTYSNSCFACAENRVISYSDGSCESGDAT